MQSPDVPQWWDVCPTYSKVEDSLLPTYTEALEFLGLKANIDYRIVRSKPTVVHLNRTKQHIRLLSGDRPELMVSANIGGYAVREAGLLKQEVIENCEARTRHKKAIKTIGFVEGTPEGDNYYKDNYDIKKSDPARKLRRFILHTTDNAKNLADGYAERLIQTFAHNPAKVRSYLYGEFSSFRSGDVYAQFVESRNLIPTVRADPMRPIAICLDFNATPLTWSAWQTIPYKRGAFTRMREVCLAESSLACTDLYSAAIEIGMAFNPSVYSQTVFELWGDRTGHAKSHKAPGTDYSNLKKYLAETYREVVIRAAREVTPIRGSVDVTNRLLLYELALICDHCVNVRRSFNTTKWATGKDDIEKKAGETHTHHGDGLRYRLWQLYKDVNIENLTGSNIMGANWA